MVSATKIKIVQKAQESFAPLIRIVSQKSPESLPQKQAEPPNEIAHQGIKYLRFDAQFPVEVTGSKAVAIKDGDRVTDYLDVTIEGYLSTFGNEDRDGDTVRAGAFKKTIAEFLKNPVLLGDHTNKLTHLLGSYEAVREDAKGLWVRGKLTNSPSEYAKHARFLAVERHLKAQSMGGFFAMMGQEIVEVNLLEGSLVPIPSNSQAIFSVRECTELEVKRWKFEQSET